MQQRLPDQLYQIHPEDLPGLLAQHRTSGSWQSREKAEFNRLGPVDHCARSRQDSLAGIVDVEGAALGARPAASGALDIAIEMLGANEVGCRTGHVIAQGDFPDFGLQVIVGQAGD